MEKTKTMVLNENLRASSDACAAQATVAVATAKSVACNNKTTVEGRIFAALRRIGGSSIHVVSKNGGNHRNPHAIIDGKLHVELSHCHGHLCRVGIEVPVMECPDEALRTIQCEDDPHIGQPHHWELSEDNAKLLYFRHGTTAFGETKGRYLEREKETFIFWMEVKSEHEELLHWSVDTYHESPWKTLGLTVAALEALAY